MINTTATTAGRIRAGGLQPMRFGKAIIFFVVPALLFRLFVYNGMAWFIRSGVGNFEAFLFSYISPLAILLVAAVVGYCLEGNGFHWHVFAQRMRLQRMNGTDRLWTTGGFLVGFFGSGALMFTAPMIAQLAPFTPPASLPPVMNPLVPQQLVLTTFLGVPLAGNWTVVALYLVLLCFNIVGEELWWRGYILPRQELAHGRWTWLLHGTMWALFHAPIYPWNVFVLLPTCLSLAFVAQRTRNTWPGMITHLITNGLVLVPIVLGVMK